MATIARFADIKDKKKEKKGHKKAKQKQVIVNRNYSTWSPQAIPQYYTPQSLLTLTPLSLQQGPSVDNINTCTKLGIPLFDSLHFLKLRIQVHFIMNSKWSRKLVTL